MLSLPDVTLVCVFNQAHRLHLMAVEDCLKGVSFGDVIVRSDVRDMDEYIQVFHHEIPRRLKTSHILGIQWDSWIVTPTAWRPEFLDYDYIGAPWWYKDGMNVGNSGFALRSGRLMRFLAEHPEDFPLGRPEDHILCREYQKRLPQFRWAPEELAWHFAIERTAIYPLSEVFGFHGLFNFPYILGNAALRTRLELARKERCITAKPEWEELGILVA